MDNLCHTLVGAAFAEAGLKRRTRWGGTALMIAANLPDLDVLVFATSTPSVAFRRGWTHGVLAQALLPVAMTAAFMLWHRRGWRGPATSGPPVRPWWLLALGYVGVYSHVGLDYLNNYGVRLLTPFDWRWFYGDAVFIVDPWLWLMLGAGVWLARRRGHPRAARVALAAASLYITAMVAVAQTARAQVIEAWTARSGTAPQALMVGPVPVVPWTREVVIDAGRVYHAGRYDVRTGALALDPSSVPKGDDDPDVSVARRDPSAGGILVWSRFPFWERSRGPAGEDVLTLRDMRFRTRGLGGFAATVPVGTPPAGSGSRVAPGGGG